MLRRTLLVSLVAASAALTVGCDDKGQLSEDAAVRALDVAAPLVQRDVEQIRKGMPEGLKVLEKRLPDDPLGKRLELQEAIKAARSNVDDLVFAKSTFFCFVSPDGFVLRSEIDPDRLVDQNLVQALPGLKKAFDAKGALVEDFGEMDALRGVKQGPDIAWVAATATSAGEDGKPRGLFATGWSMRLYARGLETQVRAKLTEISKERGDKTVPVAYVYVVKGKVAYGDPDSPEANADKLAELDVVAKSASGDFKTHLEIEGRAFGFAARRAPYWGDDVAIAVVASVY